jgi:hypothetical protein
MKKKTNCLLLLPRGYISPSALDLWEKNPKDYAKRYFNNEQLYESPEMRFGKRVHKAIELGHDEDPSIDLIAKTLHKYDMHEVETTAYLPSPYGDIPLFGIIDNLHSETKDFKDWKTGKEPWTQKRAVEATQNPFYALMLELLTGRRPSKAEIVWLETRGKGADLALTGRVQPFKVLISTADLERIKKRIIRACTEIDRAYRLHLKKQITL